MQLYTELQLTLYNSFRLYYQTGKTRKKRTTLVVKIGLAHYFIIRWTIIQLIIL